MSAYQREYKLCCSNRKKANFCRVQWIYFLSLSRAKVFAKLISNAVQPQFFGKRANADLCWRFQTRRATRRQANQKHETETKGSHNQSPECILLSYIHQSKNTISHKNSNTFKGGHTPLIMISTEHDVGVPSGLFKKNGNLQTFTEPCIPRRCMLRIHRQRVALLSL